MSLETFLTLIETMITPEQFAEVLCDDLDLPSSSFSAAIASSIRQQCEQFSGDMIPDDEEDRRVIIKVCMCVLYRWPVTDLKGLLALADQMHN